VARGDVPRDVADDAATGQALLNFLLRAIACGATDVATVSSLTALREEELDGRPFRDVLRAHLSS
jgi:hypothetical protein